MSKEPIISVSGLRGIIGESLDPTLACRYVAAYAAGCDPGPILVSRDGRSTGPMLADAVRSALVAMGRDVVDVGVAATPTLGVLVRHGHAAGGIQISASHNPPEYNGIKLFDATGRVIPAAAGERVIDRYRAGNFRWVPFDQLGSVTHLEDTIGPHLERVLATVNVDRIRERHFKVVLDSNHGAGGILGTALLQHLGCDVVALGLEPNGRFAHPPEPTAENLAGVSQQIVDAQADVGFCQDPDADRLALIDASGRYVGEEYTVAVVVQHALRQARSQGSLGPIVTNCATSRMTEDLANQYGVPFVRSAVGEANVTDAMKRVNAMYGGEGNGGPIDPRVGLVRDSFVGMAQVLDAMAATKEPLAEMVDALPRYLIRKSKASVEGLDLTKVLAQLRDHFQDAESSDQDGLRFDWPGRWLLVRASNTEPIVRIIAEAESESAADALIGQAAAVIESH